MNIIYFYIIITILASCSQNTITNKEDPYTNSQTKNADLIFISTGKTDTGKKEALLPKEETLEVGVNFIVIKNLFINQEGIGDDTVSLYYITDTGKRILIARTGGGQIFKDIKIEGNYFYYTFSGTGGEMMNIMDLRSMKIVARIRGGIYTEDKKYIYSCKEGGYGPGEASIVDLLEMKSYNAMGFIYEQYKNSSDKEIHSIKCELKKSSGIYSMEFSARTGYDTDTGSEITSYIFDLSTKKIKNQKTKEIMTIPADEIAENPYEQ